MNEWMNEWNIIHAFKIIDEYERFHEDESRTIFASLLYNMYTCVWMSYLTHDDLSEETGGCVDNCASQGAITNLLHPPNWNMKIYNNTHENDVIRRGVQKKVCQSNVLSITVGKAF
jgi:hypothetical protein